MTYRTRQEFFDDTLLLMIAQGEPAYSSEKASCMYRMTKHGGMVIGCAIGVHLPQDAPFVVANCMGGFGMLLEVARVQEINLSDLLRFEVDGNEAFLKRIQACHDDNLRCKPFVESFKGSMKQLAADAGLMYKET